MEGPPPPPPPHGENPRTARSGGLPDGKYDIFVIPPSSAGSGFLYLPSLQTQRNSFLAGCACTATAFFLYSVALPVAKEWFFSTVNGGGSGVLMLVLGVGVVSWALGKTQGEGTGTGTGAGPGASTNSSGATSGSSRTHADPPPRPQPESRQEYAPPPPPPPREPTPPPAPEPEPEAEPPPRPQSPPPKPKSSWQRSTPSSDGRSAWERAREETRKREEERKRAAEIQRRRDELEKERQRQREKETLERLEREFKEKKAKEEEAAKKAESELKAKQAKDEADKKVQREKERREREAREALLKAAKEAREAKEALERTRKEDQERREREEREKKDSRTAEAARSASASNLSSNKRPPMPSAKTERDDDAYSFRPYDRPKTNQKSSAGSVYSDDSYAPSATTAKTTPPGSTRGPYSTKDPDKIIIKGVYSFNNAFMRTPISQLISGQGNVTDGLILRITTEGLFIDDDVRGVPQREWDIKAWTMKLAEVSLVPSSVSPSIILTQAQSVELQGHLILRASIRDQEGKKYVFILSQTEGWKVAVGLQRLRKGSQVRALGVAGMPTNEARIMLEGLGWV